MNRIVINTEAILHNYNYVQRLIGMHDGVLTVVTKALSGNTASIEALIKGGIDSIADSRLDNLKTVTESGIEVERWYLKPPHPDELEDVIKYSDVSLNTELSTVKEINKVAKKVGTVHKILLMIELGDLREGILPGTLVTIYNDIFNLENIDIIGIGTNLGCLSGTVPGMDQLMQLVLYKELLELKFQRKLRLLSAGSSATLPFLIQGVIPKQVNHFRVGESILLGTDLIGGGSLAGLRDDGFILEAGVVEIKKKNLVPTGEILDDLHPFNTSPQSDPKQYAPGEQGFRAVVTIGELDTDISSLTPLNPEYEIAGASSDLTVLNVGSDDASIRVGDFVKFKVGYSALIRLMNNQYTAKLVL
ncbi:MAG: alanine racemase [Candidatus Fermentibacteria bacterium]|nr:alanine racemase [Candidatus Fermentibacteria bacterium]